MASMSTINYRQFENVRSSPFWTQLSCSIDKVAWDEESPDSSIARHGQPLTHVPALIENEDRFIKSSFLAIGAKIYLFNYNSQIRIIQRTEHKPTTHIGGEVIKRLQDTIDNIGCRVLNCLFTFRYIENFLPDDPFNLRNNLGTVVAQRLWILKC